MSVGLAEYQAVNVPIIAFSPVGLMEQPTVDRVENRLGATVRTLFELLNEVSDQISRCRNAEEFRAFREEAFPSYSQLLSSLGSISNAQVARKDLPGLIEASFSTLEREFSSQESRDYFGDEAFYEIQFCVSTFRSGVRWLPFLITHKPADELRPQDLELARNYQSSASWTYFHLCGLGIAFSKRQTIAPDVLQELLDGLRHAVMVYAYVRQALDLRSPVEESIEPLTITWDAEDEALARAD